MASSTPIDEPSIKRRKLNEQNPCLQTLPSDQFLSKITLFDGDRVSIFAGEKEFWLPRALLCYHSTFFNAAFTGGFKETIEQKLNLASEHTAETFELVVQWIYTGNLILSDQLSETTAELEKFIAEGSKRKMDVKTRRTRQEEHLRPRKNVQNVLRDRISKYIAFFRLADEIELLGSTDKLLPQIKSILEKTEPILQAGHIRSAIQLPSNHPLKILIAQSCVSDYMRDAMRDDVFHPGTHCFRFHKEIDEVEAYASDLFKEFRKALASRGRDADGHVYYEDTFHPGHTHIRLFIKTSYDSDS